MPTLNNSMDTASSAIQVPELPEAADAAAGEFELFFNDSNVETDKQMAYILMMATDCIPDFSIKTIHPYSEFMSNRKIGGGGWVRKLSANKEIIVTELLRRDPNAKPNKSNRSGEELLRLFKPLTDRRDIDFVIKKELEYRASMSSTLSEMNSKRMAQDLKEKTPKRPRTEKKLDLTENNGSLDVQLQQLTDEKAEIAMDAAEKLARENNFKVTIAIVDATGVPMLVKRLEGAYPHSFDLAMTKATIACRFQKNTSQLQEAPDISRGGVPLLANGVCIGGIGVSGDKQPNCERVAYAAVDKLVEEARQESLDAVDALTTV